MSPRKGTRRACDPCSVRKVRCDGNHPCSRCEAASWDCTYLKTHGKSGPKGPRRTTEAAIKRLQERGRSEVYQRARSESDSNLDDGSPSTVDLPPLDNITLTSDPPFDHFPMSPPFPEQYEPQRISISSIAPYLEVYQARGYGIWPVVETEILIARLLTHPDDTEAYALATAICAAMKSQFQLGAEPISPLEGHFRVSGALFEAEARRARGEFDHMERLTIWSLLTSFFLHVHFADSGRMSTSTVLLGEAITKAHMIGLHKPSHYYALGKEQKQHSLRIYWLLFITERYLTI